MCSAGLLTEDSIVKRIQRSEVATNPFVPGEGSKTRVTNVKNLGKKSNHEVKTQQVVTCLFIESQ